MGDRIEAGDELGLIGSSGCSTHPHLHIEAWDGGYGNTLVDPFNTGLWSAAPPYVTDLTLMDVVLRPDGFDTLPDIQDPPPTNTVRVETGQSLGFGVSAAGGLVGDEIGLIVVGPDGFLDEPVLVLDKGYRHHFWWWNYYFNVTGTWSVSFSANGVEKEKVYFDVVP